jgi:hypothetical protein
MFFSSSLLFVAVLASVHSFTFVAATPNPEPTPAPRDIVFDKRQNGVAGGPGTPILSTISDAWAELPYQVYPFAVLRGPQIGYNQCNSSTMGPNSLCQTLIINSIVRSFSSSSCF